MEDFIARIRSSTANEFVDQWFSLPKDPKFGLTLYQDFWYIPSFIPGIMSFQKNFISHDEDIILASQPKSGTTWQKALAFAIINRSKYTSLSENPLLNSNPQDLVKNLEMRLYLPKEELPNFDDMSVPRVFATHMPYVSLPESIKNSKSRIVYLCRNPLDTLISYWHYSSQSIFKIDASVDEYADSFAKGVSCCGPFWDHVLSYWNESLKNPNKVLFLKYEDMKENTALHVKKMAEFLGYPFSEQEESEGVIDQIVQLCSFDNLKNLEVNQDGSFHGFVKNKAFFRKGQVGDWNNHLNSLSAERIKLVLKEKLSNSGLTFKFS